MLLQVFSRVPTGGDKNGVDGCMVAVGGVAVVGFHGNDHSGDVSLVLRGAHLVLPQPGAGHVPARLSLFFLHARDLPQLPGTGARGRQGTSLIYIFPQMAAGTIE